MTFKTLILTTNCLLLFCYQATCCDVAATSSNGQIIISGLTNSENTKLFDADINAVWECNPWNGNACSGNETIPGLTAGATYFLSVQSDACSEWIPITVVGGGTAASCSDGIQNQDETGTDCGGNNCPPCQTTPTDCNINVTSTGNSVTINGLSSLENTKLFDADYNTVWDCNPWNGTPCSGTETVNGLTTGATYFLSAASVVCDEWIPITIGGGNGGDELPDLEVEFLESISGNPGEVVFFPFQLINSGNAYANDDYEIQTYISTDTNLSADDIPEGNIVTGFTADGSNTEVNGAITIPASLADGTYYLIMKVDDSNVIAESDENNNTAYTQMTVGSGNNSLPDLTIEYQGQSYVEPPNIYNTEFLWFTYIPSNVGGVDAASFSIKSYISLDATLSSDDIFAHTENTGSYPAGFVGQTTSTYTIPPNFATGTYYLITKIDADDEIVEADETNNIVVQQFTYGDLNSCEINIVAVDGTINIKGLPANSNTKVFDENLAVVYECNPWNGTPCTGDVSTNQLIAGDTYYVSVQSEACDEWIPVVITGGSSIEYCEVDLGISGFDCYRDHGDGTFTTTSYVGSNTYTENIYTADGELTLSNTLQYDSTWVELSNNTIVVQNNSGILNTVPIDPVLVATYTTGDNYFADIAAKSNDGHYFIVGRVVNADSDDIYLHKLNAEGFEVNSMLLANLTSTAYHLDLEEQFNFIEIIPTAAGGADVMLQQFLFIDPTTTFITDRHILFETDGAIQNVNEVNLGYTNSLNTTYTNNVIRLYYCDTYMLTKVRNDHFGGTYTTTEIWDYTVTPKKLLQTNIHTFNNGQGAFTRDELEVTFEDGTSAFASFTNYTYINPNPSVQYLTYYDANDNIIEEIEIDEIPFAIFQNNGSISYITGTTLTATDCESGGNLISENDLGKTIQVEENNFSINKLFPNPTSGEAFLKIESNVNQMVHLTIYDVTGRMKFNQKIELESGINTSSMNLEDLQHGIYNLTIHDEDNNIETIRFVKN